MVADFESLPSSLGPFSTKFFLRDYEAFVESSEELNKGLPDDLLEFEEMLKTDGDTGNELKKFLDWPEFQFWKGFVRLEGNKDKP